MGSQEFSVPVRGSSGEPVSVGTDSGTVETNNYREGDTFDFDGSAYPYTINPTETIQEIMFTVSADIEFDITTRSGTTITGIPLNSVNLTENFLEIDSITLKDPNTTTARVAGYWKGE